MVREWAENVPEDATVLHLGDLSYRNNSWFQHVIAPKLTGARKYLIPGNHDKQRAGFYHKAGFKLISPFEISYPVGKAVWTVSFSHYPLTEPPFPNHVHIHGHLHNNGYSGKEAPFIPFAAHQINVSVEQLHYRPVNLKVLLDGYIVGAY
jgi:calcineurin-like phosphoesterase family protein